MSFVETTSECTPLAQFAGAAALAANLAAANNLRATIAGSTSLVANLVITAPLGNTSLPGSTALSAFLRIGSEANVFLGASLPGSTSLAASFANQINPFIVLSGSTSLEADLSVAASDRADLLIFADLVPAAAAGANVQVLGARFKVNGVEKPIRSFRFRAPTGAAGTSLDIGMSKPTPADVPIGAEYQFEIFSGGSWITVLAGVFGSRSQSVEFAGDTLSISTIDNATDKLGKAPKRPTVFYDPIKTGTLREETSEILKDTFGNEYPTTFTADIGLDLYTVLQWAFVTVCGFTSYKTNLPNFSITRADFPIGRPVRETIVAITGMFEPLFFETGGELWIVDATLALPAGLTPRTIAASRFRSFSAETGPDAGNLDGLVVIYSESGSGDFYTQRFETEEVQTDQPGYAATITTIEREFFEYRNTSDPQTIVRSMLKSETRTIENESGETIGEETIEYELDNQGRVTGHDKEVYGLIPTSELDSPDTTFGLVYEERQRLGYTTNSRGQSWLARRETQTRALVATDTENPYLEQDFKQDFIEAHKAGNLRAGMLITTEPTKTLTESFSRLANGQTSVTTTQIDHLRGTVTNSRTENESGESEISLRQKTRRLIVWREGVDLNSPDLSQKQLRDLNVGELPIRDAKALAKRRLARIGAGKGTAGAVLFGYDAGVRRGSTYRITDRSGSSLGNFLTLGFDVTGADLGTDAASIQTSLQLLEL